MLDSEANELEVKPQKLEVLDILVICFYEFLGTAMLLLGYNFTNDGAAVAFSLFVGILISNKISGGNV